MTVLSALLLSSALVGGEKASVLGPLPAEFEVHAVGTYSGGEPVAVRLDDSGHTTKQAEVVVNSPEKPVLLVLTAYDPVVWRVGRTEATEIIGILVSGYHGQALTGVDGNTPRAISSYKKRGPFRYFYATTASPHLLRMNEAVERLVGKEIARFEFELSDDGVFYVGQQPAPGQAIVYAEEQTLYRVDGTTTEKQLAELNSQPVAATPEEGIEALVAEGKLRPATQQDIDTWVNTASKPYLRFNPRLRVETEMRVGRTYVALEPFTLPDGLYGAHRRDFLIPDGVPLPVGNHGHCSFYTADGKIHDLMAMMRRRMRQP